jgi:hypothetical protein
MKCDQKLNIIDLPLLCDSRSKLFDISHLHFSKTFEEIFNLRSQSQLFDVVIKSNGTSFKVFYKTAELFM